MIQGCVSLPKAKRLGLALSSRFSVVQTILRVHPLSVKRKESGETRCRRDKRANPLSRHNISLDFSLPRSLAPWINRSMPISIGIRRVWHYSYSSTGCVIAQNVYRQYIDEKWDKKDDELEGERKRYLTDECKRCRYSLFYLSDQFFKTKMPANDKTTGFSININLFTYHYCTVHVWFIFHNSRYIYYFTSNLDKLKLHSK